MLTKTSFVALDSCGVSSRAAMAGSTQATKDTTGALSFDSEHKRRAENLAFDIDAWYPRLRSFTFPTVFVPLTLEEAHAIVHCYRECIQGRRGTLTPVDAGVLRELERRLDVALQEDALQGCAFPRLCGRSLKDADVLRPERALRQFEERLASLQASSAGGSLEMQALLSVEWMRVESGAETLSLLVSSERAFVDLNDWIQYGEPEQVALRRWQPQLTQDWEFRIFVHEGRLTAISQYEHYCHYPALAPVKARLEEMIVDFWQLMHDSVGAESYVADLGYLRDEDRILLVELGPFLNCTGTSCFNWTRDAEVLRHGPREFRLTSADAAMPTATVAELVDIMWLDRWRHPPQSHAHILTGLMQLANAKAVSKRRCRHTAAVLVALGSAIAVAMIPSSTLALRRRWAAAAISAAAFAAMMRLPWTTSLSSSKCRAGSLLFVYGTLKHGFHWHQKFLSLRGTFVGTATTAEPVPLVVGACGVPYLLLDARSRMGGCGETCVRGELWRVDDLALRGMDDYEGIGKGYYARLAMECRLASTRGQAPAQLQRSVTAQVYGVADSALLWSDEELHSMRCVAEYTLEMQDSLYRPVEHIALKQQLYLDGSRRYNSVEAHAKVERAS